MTTAKSASGYSLATTRHQHSAAHWGWTLHVLPSPKSSAHSPSCAASSTSVTHTMKPLVIVGIGYDVTEYLFPKSWGMQRIHDWFNRHDVPYAVFGCPSDPINPYVFVTYHGGEPI